MRNELLCIIHLTDTFLKVLQLKSERILVSSPYMLTSLSSLPQVGVIGAFLSTVPFDEPQFRYSDDDYFLCCESNLVNVQYVLYLLTLIWIIQAVCVYLLVSRGPHFCLPNERGSDNIHDYELANITFLPLRSSLPHLQRRG